MEKKQYDHVISMINAALIHGEPAPWMYEALTIAQVLDGHAPGVEAPDPSGAEVAEEVEALGRRQPAAIDVAARDRAVARGVVVLEDRLRERRIGAGR